MGYFGPGPLDNDEAMEWLSPVVLGEYRQELKAILRKERRIFR